ncbi:DUF6259 domain-containing protein, partial [Verrucomicrobiota bacterium]
RYGYEYPKMCPSARGWQAHMAKVARETVGQAGLDGIYLDSVGAWVSQVCGNRRHHPHAERGSWQRGIAEMFTRVRSELDAVNPEAILYAEAPSTDYLLQFMDASFWGGGGAADRDADMDHGMAGLIRFLVPAHKLWTLEFGPKTILAGVGSCREGDKDWSARAEFVACVHDAQRENADAYESGAAEPLIPTLRRTVYANCFRGPEKAIYTIYNGDYVTARGELVCLPRLENTHYVDLHSWCEVPVRTAGGRDYLSLTLVPKTAVAIGRFPRALRVGRTGSGGRMASIARDPAGHRLELWVLRHGRVRRKALRLLKDGTAAVPAGKERGLRRALKLYAGDRLVDMAES